MAFSSLFSSVLYQHRGRVFAAYRRIFRARKDLFDGDVQAMQESRKAIKAAFIQNANIPVTQQQDQQQHLDGLLSMVDEAVDMMRHGIVRGNLNPKTGNYEVKVKPQHTEGADHTNVEPITPDIVAKMEKPMVSSSSSCSSSSNKNG